MNTLTVARFTTNLLIGGAGVALFVYAILGTPSFPAWILIIGAIAVLGGVAQFVASILYPKTIRPAWDEQTVASHRGSYQFGYWMALIAFWLLFGLTQWGEVEAQTAFLWLGPILIATPSIWMIVATLSGRAG